MAVKLAQSVIKNGRPFTKPPSIQEKLVQLKNEINAAYIDREDEVNLTIATVIGQSSLLLVGPPGTAKSATLEAIIASITKANKFNWLMGKFTEPNEIFGATDIMALKGGKVARITTDKLPEAHYAFLDEFWKASTAIGNTLLRIVNERRFNNGNGDAKVPLRALVAASNEYPQDGELGAMFDRFVIRKEVKYLDSPTSRRKLMESGPVNFVPNVKFTLEEFDQAYAESLELPIPNTTWEKVAEIVEECIKQGIRPSDRRLAGIGKVIRAYAYVMGGLQVEIEHLEVLSHVLWMDPVEQPRKVAQIVARIANPIAMRVSELTMQAREILSKAPRHSGELHELETANAELDTIIRELERMKELPAVLKSLEIARDAKRTILNRTLNRNVEE